MPEQKISSLHFLTPPPTYSETFFDLIHSAIDAGIDWIQYRDKENDDFTFQKIATEVFSICKNKQVTFIVNDRVEVAKSIDADGVHVGQSDLNLLEVIKTINNPEKIIGVSTNTIEQIIEAKKNGASYVGFGPYQFTTTRKNLNPIVGISGFQKVFESKIYTDNYIPLVAIGGINLDDIPILKKVGVKHFAVSSAISSAKNPTETIQKFKQLL